jgi:hypothetical protein
MNMHQRIPTVLLEISPKSTSPRINSKKPSMSLCTSSPSQDHLPSTIEIKALVARLQVLFKKSLSSKNQSPNQELSKNEKYLNHSSVATMTEETCLSESIIKIHYPNLFGKFLLNHSTIIIISLFSSMGQDRNSIHTDHSLF